MSTTSLDGFSSVGPIGDSGNLSQLRAAGLAPAKDAFTVQVTSANTLKLDDSAIVWTVAAWGPDKSTASGTVTDRDGARHRFTITLASGTLACTILPTTGDESEGDDGGSWSANDGRTRVGGGGGATDE